MDEEEEEMLPPLAPEPRPPPRIDKQRPVDLTGYRNGARKDESGKAYLPSLNRERNDYKSPAAMMRSLGFCPTKHMTPLQFLVAVMNDRVDLVYRNPKKAERAISQGGIGINYRIECAKVAAKYMHMEMPKIEIHQGEQEGYGKQLVDRVVSGQERVRTRRMIIETVERLSPDIPLEEANYPPVFDAKAIALKDGETVEKALLLDGDTEYNPDLDD